MPWLSDRRPATTVVSGLQFSARDEHRLQFPATNFWPEGISADGRFLRVSLAGAHSDIGGSYEKNGLSTRTFNMMSQFVNGSLGDNLIKKVTVPSDPAMSVIHDSSQHEFYWIKVSNRIEFNKQDLLRREIEPISPAMEHYTHNAKPLGDSAISNTPQNKDEKSHVQTERPSSDNQTMKRPVEPNLLSAMESPSSRLISQVKEVPRVSAQVKL